MIEVVDFLPEHLEKIVLKDIHKNERPKKVTSQAVTFLSNGHPIAIFGGNWLGKHVFHIWGLVSEEVKKTPLDFYKTCMKVLKNLESIYSVHRFQIDIRSTYLEGHKWAEKLGFQHEGIMRSFGSDKMDHHLYGRIV